MRHLLLCVMTACSTTEPTGPDARGGANVDIDRDHLTPPEEHAPPVDAAPSCPGIDATPYSPCCEYIIHGCAFPEGTCFIPDGAECVEYMCGPTPAQWYKVCRPG